MTAPVEKVAAVAPPSFEQRIAACAKVVADSKRVCERAEKRLAAAEVELIAARKENHDACNALQLAKLRLAAEADKP
jgi:hypothetical protein